MATLRVKDRGAGPVIYGRWRHGARMIERPIGRGWLVAAGEPGAKPNGRSIGSWRDRRGRPDADHLTVLAATQMLRDVQERWETEVAVEEARIARARREHLTVAEAAARFLAWGAVDDPHSDREAWKHSYAVSLRSYVGRLVRVLGAERPIDEVTHADLVRVLTDLVPVRNGQPTGAAPTRKFLSNYALPLKGLFALAVREGWILEDPAASLPSYKPKRKRAGDPVRREEYLTPEEVWAVVGELESEQDRAAALCMAMAGLRPGEAVALRWQDVDLRASAFRIVQSRTAGITGTPKSGPGRGVPMTDEVAAALEVVARRELMTRPLDRVFTRRGTGHLDLQALRDRFNAAQDAVGVVPRRGLRQLRNTFGTVCAAEGVPLRTLQEWMGHESITTTERYASHMPRARDAALISAAFSVGAPTD